MSTTKETSPATSGAGADKPAFTEREMKLIIAAMMSLKSGAPDVDYTRFQKNGDFKTLKTAQNTWSTLKKKIAGMNPEAAESAQAATPQKPKATPKKRAKKESDGEDADDAAVADAEKSSPTKKPKATPRKKKEVDEGDEASGYPKKKTPRKSPVKKTAAAKKSEETIKSEDMAEDDTAAIEAEVMADVKATAAENGDEAPAAEAEKAEDVKMEGAVDAE